jgi:hypothetical protein
MSKFAKRTDQKLWENCKAEAVYKMGKFSARAMQYAVKLYKEKGGKYEGQKSADNSLVKWTKEEWNYVGEKGHSRYLPKKVREKLTTGEKAATSRAKNKGTEEGKQWVKQPEKIARKTSKYKI